MKILLTGATGYVGGRLLRALEHAGRSPICLARRPDRLRGVAGPATTVVQGDVLDAASLDRALAGVTVAYYLVHAMTASGSFSETDREAARRFGDACRRAGVARIIYLGGLGSGAELSEHLASRQEVGHLLRAAGVPVVEFRASVIVGAGSTSFEIVRALVDKLPFMVTPRWVRTPAQPIAIDDVVSYLVEALDADLPKGGIFEIGGADRVSYGDLMREYARQRNLRRVLLPVPVLSPGLSGLWLSLVAPDQAKVGRALIEGVRNETVVRDPAALETFRVKPLGIGESVRRAVEGTPPAAPALSGARVLGPAILSVAVCLLAGLLGQLLSGDAVSTWYLTLAKPPWTPPGAVFGPVWTALYVMMGLAAWRIWTTDGIRQARLALGVFVLHLAVNAAWSGFFFGLRSPGGAFAWIVLLDVLVAATILLFTARSRLAAGLLVPYAAWLGYATALNFAIWRMNS